MSSFLGITPDYIVSFLEERFPEPTPVLRVIGAYGRKHGVPIVGPLVGRLLHLLVRLSEPSSILEVGTAIGYSTIWLASALPKNGQLATIEISYEALQLAKENLEKAGLSAKVRFLHGDASEVVPSLRESFDMIFLDTDKLLYPKLLPKLIELLRVDGVLIADNTLWGGKVATSDSDSSTVAIKKFDQMIIDEKRLFSMIIPIRDGLSVSVKLDGEQRRRA
jgi:predicted O-methyltransferase YrrM